MNTTKDISPVKASERFAILDILRGFALLGICMANFPEFSLYNFLPQEVAAVYLRRREILYALFPPVRHRLFHYHPQCGTERSKRLPHLLPADGSAACHRIHAPDVYLERRHTDALCAAWDAAASFPPHV